MPRNERADREVLEPTVDTFLADYVPQVRSLAHGLRRLVIQSVPGASERVKPGWRLIGYHVPDGRRGRYFCFVAPLADAVRLGFEYGVLLRDQAALEGDGSQVRFVTLRRAEDIGSERLSPLVVEAAMAAIARRRG